MSFEICIIALLRFNFC